jgi:hypothetical protein
VIYLNLRRSIIFGLAVVIWFAVAFVPLSTEQVGEYDPWLDINDDGKIDIYDVAVTAQAFGTYGDPTKNVTVTNWPIDEDGNLKVKTVDTSLKVYKDSVQIIVFDWTNGIYVKSYPSNEKVNDPLVLPFTFSPKPSFQNVTDLWISFTVRDHVGTDYEGYKAYYQLDCIFNNQTIYHISERHLVRYEHVLSVHIEDENVYASIIPSLNNLTLTNPQVKCHGAFVYYSMMIFQVKIYIEYEYLA